MRTFGSLDVVIVYEGPWEATGDTLRAQLALKQATFNGMSAEDYVASELAGIDDPDFDLEQVTAELLEGLTGDLPLAEALVARYEIDGDQLTVDPGRRCPPDPDPDPHGRTGGQLGGSEAGGQVKRGAVCTRPPGSGTHSLSDSIHRTGPAHPVQQAERAEPR